MSEKGTINAVFVLTRLQKEYHAKGKKLHMWFVHLDKALDKHEENVGIKDATVLNLVKSQNLRVARFTSTL